LKIVAFAIVEPLNHLKNLSSTSAMIGVDRLPSTKIQMIQGKVPLESASASGKSGFSESGTMIFQG